MRDPIAQQVTDALQGSLGGDLIAVVLFGSRARGDAHEESDWDMLILAERLPQQVLERHLALKRLLPPECRGAVSLLAKTPEEFEGHLTSWYLDVAVDGKILYDPKGYAAQRLEQVRRIINRAGLRRQRTPAGDVWEWDSPPAQPWRLEWSA
jgi:uncharacterized protein